MKILPRSEVGNAFLFDGPFVVGVEVVDGRHRVAIVQQAAAEVATDKAGGSGYEYVHRLGCVVWENDFVFLTCTITTPGYRTGWSDRSGLNRRKNHDSG